MRQPPGLTCQELVELVTAYLEGALLPAERERFEVHHDECPDCRAHVSQVRFTVASLSRLRPSHDEDLSSSRRSALDLFRSRGLHLRKPGDRDIPLGLGSDLAAMGDHIAYFWESEPEFDAIAGFLAAGLTRGEACVLIGHHTANERLMARLERRGLRVRALMQEHQLQAASVRSSAEGLLHELDERIKDAVHRGMPAVRILGTLGWGRGTPGWPSDRELLRMEAQVTGAVARLPCIVVCTYGVTGMPPTILQKGGLECHPLTFRIDGLRPNEHHVPPEQFLEKLSGDPG